MDRLSRARAIADAWNCQGGILIRQEIDERIAEINSDLDNLMCEPDKLTGKTAIAKANRRRSLLNLKEWIADELRPLDGK